MMTVQILIEKLRDEVPYFIASDLVHIESGLSIGGESIRHRLDPAAAPGAYAEVIKANRFALELLGLDAKSTEDVLITTSEVYILLRMIGAEYYHLLAIARTGTLGLARVLMRKYDSMLRQALGEIESL